MNYYPRYPGDYLAKTLDLTMVEDGAYTRLIDWYYSNEQPIPHARRHVIARASTGSERAAVDTVLAKFFEFDADLHRHERIDEEIAKAAPRIEAAKANGSKGGRRPKNPTGYPAVNPPGYANGNPADNPPGTHWASSPKPAPELIGTTEQAVPVVSARAEVGIALKRAGISPMSFNLDDPRLATLLQQGATPAEFEGIAREAVQKQIRAPWSWVLKVLQERRKDAAAISLAQAPPAPTGPSDYERTQEMLRRQAVPLSAEEKARADDARRLAMAAVRNISPGGPTS